jgi:gas vesicle protein
MAVRRGGRAGPSRGVSVDFRTDWSRPDAGSGRCCRAGGVGVASALPLKEDRHVITGEASFSPALREGKEQIVASKTAPINSLDIDRLIREEVTDWFTSNRKGFENSMRKVADQVKDEVERYWMEENQKLRERVNSLEEEIKRMKQIISVVRTQVDEEEIIQG